MSKELPQRNRGFEETHSDLLETAVKLISEKGIEALSMAELARAAGINRTTVYYHFKGRDELIREVKCWSSEKLAEAFNTGRSQQERIDFITRFVLENPQLIKLWIDDLVSEGDIRDCYPNWDKLVNGISEHFRQSGEGDGDAEVYSVIMLTSAIIGPHVFRHRVERDENIDSVVERFRVERQRLLKAVSLLRI
ncbi:TetR/AcrR family transcriptional regulator [Litorivivens sp.]|uniref:TetR/AcrR family transcriptional regulator n=1 Tax=Litorivivens sp. TaxID=2020868 RepID=UPI00356AA939